MGVLEQLINDMESAILQKDRDLVYGSIIKRATKYFIQCLEKLSLKEHVGLEAEAMLLLVENSESIPEELRNVLKKSDPRQLELLHLLVRLSERNISLNFKQSWFGSARVMAKDHDNLALFSESLRLILSQKIWGKDIPLYDLRFLSRHKTSHPQTVLGKNRNKNKVYPPHTAGNLSRLLVEYFSLDPKDYTPLLSSNEKKQFKIRMENGKLTMGHNPIIPPGRYLYVVSPKGSLYLISGYGKSNGNTGRFHHSSLRAGQPVLCAGHLNIRKDPTTHETIISSMDHFSGHYRPSLKNLLWTALWLYEQKIIGPQCILSPTIVRPDLQTTPGAPITVEELVINDEFKYIREEYDSAKKAETEAESTHNPLLFSTGSTSAGSPSSTPSTEEIPAILSKQDKEPPKPT